MELQSEPPQDPSAQDPSQDLVPEPEPPKIVRNQKITGWRIRMYYWTRDPHILFWVAILLIGIGVFVAKQSQPKKPLEVLEAIFKREEDALQAAFKSPFPDAELTKELLQPQPKLERVLASLQHCNPYDPSSVDEVAKALTTSRLPVMEKQLALAQWTSLTSHLGEPGADLLYFAYYVHPPAFANELVGDYYAHKSKKFDRAIERYQRELEVRPEAEGLRKKILAMVWSKEDVARLKTLRADPSYTKFFTPAMDLKLAMEHRDWAGVWKPMLTLQKEGYSALTPMILTTLAGGLWLILAWQMIQASSLFSFRTFMSFPALALGAASTLPVLFLDVYQSQEWGLKEHGLFFKDFWFFVAGVGFREELCKLIAFLPLIPFLLRRQSRLEMLVIASCVGLGFAVAENVAYFQRAIPSVAFQRFLTANFFHFASTGLIGLALCDAIRSPREKGLKFIFVFLVIAGVHGCYDTFATAPSLTEGWSRSIFPALVTACLILLALAYFRVLARERGPATDQFFPGTTLVLGISVLMAAITVLSARVYGFPFAIGILIVSAIQGMMFTNIFFILLRDGLREEEPEVQPNFSPLS